VAKLGFEELCLKELGASDYRTLAKAFDALVIERIPVLTLSNHDAARRFITLIDEMYENQMGLICSAAAARPDELFIHSFSENNLTNDLPEGWMDQATRGGHAIGALASVQELGFAFQRAASRLKQMTSPDWWNNA
jgi:predicted ATPase